MVSATLRQSLAGLAFYARFLVSFTQPGYRLRRLFWPKFAADFRGQHWLVTGGSGGIGRALVLAALRGGARVTAVARDPRKLRELADSAQAAGLGGLQIECCDFSSVADTDALLRRLAAAGGRIDVLMNNVGVLNDALVVTGEGLEASFASNLLAHYQITEALIACGALGRGSAVVNISSGGAYLFPLQIAALDITDAARYRGVVAYGLHKRAQMVLTRHWRERHGEAGIDFFVMHPGWADTAGVQRSLPRFRKLLRTILRDAESAADTAVWLVAQRPVQVAEDVVWFDRKARPAHLYPHTRGRPEAGGELAGFLQQKLTSVRGLGPASSAASAPLRRVDLIGGWVCRRWTITYEDGRVTEPFGPSPTGFILYTDDGCMSATIMTAVRQPFAAGTPRAASVAERAAAFDGYFSYAGRWQLVDGRIEHIVTVALNPGMIGTSQWRDAQLVGDLLTLSAEESTARGTRRHAIAWQRVQSV